MVKIRILSQGNIPGYGVNGPVLTPFWVEKEVAMGFINNGLNVEVWVEDMKQFVRFTAADMLDLYRNKNKIPHFTDENHDEFDDCRICDDINETIEMTRVKQVPNRNVVKVNKQKILANEPEVYIIEQPPIIDEDIPDFGDAYEPTPFDAFGIDDFEEK